MAGIILPPWMGGPQPKAPKPPPPPPPPPAPHPPPPPTYMPMPPQQQQQSPSVNIGGNTYGGSTFVTNQAPQMQMPQPSMEGLQALGAGEGLREGLQREGWSDDPMTEMDMPGGVSLPPSSRALAQLAGQRGRIY